MSHHVSAAGELWDVIVVGGGPAGLAAAYWLARYRRRVRVHDAGEPRNRAAWVLHGYPGVPDATPAELRDRMREQALSVGAELCAGRVLAVTGAKDDFRIRLDRGRRDRARRVLLAYGRRDAIPAIPGLAAAYGRTAHHCPDCDGPSALGAAVGVIGRDRQAGALALFLLTWAERVVLLTHGRPLELAGRSRDTLREHGVAVIPARIERVLQRAGRIRGLRLVGGRRLPLDRLFISAGTAPASDIGRRLGCRIDAAGRLATDAGQETSVPGVYAAGDVVAHPHLAISAAADGVHAALAIHRSLLPPEFALPAD